jgi:hypothetical protein
MIGTYYKLALLPDEIRTANKIRSKQRLDCIAFTDLIDYKGLTYFVNFKGQLFFYKTPCRDFVNTDRKRLAEWSLTNNSINLSSIYIEDFDFPEIGFGYPNAKRLLSNGSINPMFDFRNDGYLFLMNSDYTEIEILIIPEGRNLITGYYQRFIDNGFEAELKRLRELSKPFCKYDGL